MAIPTNLPQRSHIVGLWHLDEESGTRYDETSNDNDLTDNNTVLYSSSGKIGNAADLERSQSEYLSITDAAQIGLDITGEITIVTWFKREADSGSYETLVSKFDFANSKIAYVLRINSADKLECVLSNDGSNFTTTLSTDTISIGTWYHMAVTLNQVTDEIQVYLNGLANGSAVAYTTNIYDNNIAFRIGADEVGTYGDGLIDEVIVWNTCLTAAEVLQVKNITAYKYGGGFSGFSPWIFMKDMWEEHNKIFRPNKKILIPEGI